MSTKPKPPKELYVLASAYTKDDWHVNAYTSPTADGGKSMVRYVLPTVFNETCDHCGKTRGVCLMQQFNTLRKYTTKLERKRKLAPTPKRKKRKATK